MKNTSIHDRKVEVIESGNGKFCAYLHTNFTPFLIESDGEPRTEYHCDTYVTPLYSFPSLQEAEDYFANNYVDLVNVMAQAEAVKLLKANAQKAQSYLDSTDWVVAQLGEYQMLGLELPDRSDILQKREEARQDIRAYREMI
jgi:hypothetical protein